MGLFDKLKSILFRRYYDKVVSNLSKRISQLKLEKLRTDSELEGLQKKIIKIPSFQIQHNVDNKIEFKEFTSQPSCRVTTMDELMQKRKEKENERKLLLHRQVKVSFDNAFYRKDIGKRALLKTEE